MDNLHFPKFEQLSFEQRTVAALNFDKNNLILGAPGTGKTIVAIHRLHKLYEAGKRNLLMLVYNRPLMHYVNTIKKELNIDNEFDIYTINDWVYYKLYCGSVDKPISGGIINKPVPNVEGDKYKIKWEDVNKDFENIEKIYSHIVIDEGQDISNDFYSLIVKLSKNVTIFMDPNQALFKESITIPNILAIIKKDSYFTMTLNYRNSRNVADYTRKYCTDKTVFAESYKDGEDIAFIEYSNDKNKMIDNILSIVNKYDESKDIGIIVPSLHGNNGEGGQELSNLIYEKLKANLDSKYKVSIYWNEQTEKSDKRNINFNEKSIKIFSYMTVRGLDFDVVILLDDMNNIENDEYKNRIYVALTRAKEKLYIIPLEEGLDKLSELYDINYNKFPIITNMSAKDCYNQAIENFNNKKYEEALYFMHYAISILGFEENDKLLLDAMKKFAFLCNRFNKNDFAIGMISNYAEKNKVYDDQKLIYLYQKCLLYSYNAKYSYDNIDKFFKNLKQIEDKVDKDNLLSIYLSNYISRMLKSDNTPDENFAKNKIISIGYINSDIWKKHIEHIKEIRDEKLKEESITLDEEKNNSPLWAEIKELKGHELLDGSYILVIASSHIAEEHYLNKARYFGFVEKDFKLLLDYDRMPNIDIEVEKFTDKPKAIIFGAHPHSMKDKGKHTSLMEKYNEEPGYPRVFDSGVGKDLSVSSFVRVLEEVTEYLRQCRYDEEKTFK